MGDRITIWARSPEKREQATYQEIACCKIDDIDDLIEIIFLKICDSLRD